MQHESPASRPPSPDRQPPAPWRHVFVAVDNSPHAGRAADVAVAIARLHGAKLTASHAFAARLHDVRFRQMEYTLPERYQAEEELERQRGVHESLIAKGLRLIADSYLDVVERRCRDAGVAFTRNRQDGRNWQVLSREIAASDCDLVVLGALGTGAVARSMLGSVCERVVRRCRKDVLVVKDTRPLDEQQGPILVAIDGSPESFAGLEEALDLAARTSRSIEAVAVYDPYFHYAVFQGIVDVLSEEAARVFRFREQETLHEEIIDSGLAQIYRSHLEVAEELAGGRGVAIRTHLRAGKAFEGIDDVARETRPSLIVVGRIGIHSDRDMDVGSNAENLLRLAKGNVLLCSRRFVPPLDVRADASVVWTEKAQERFERVPPAVRRLARTVVHRYALESGHSIVTSAMLDACMDRYMPRAAKSIESALEALARGQEDRGGDEARGGAQRGGDEDRGQGEVGGGAAPGGAAPGGDKAHGDPGPAWTRAARDALARVKEEHVRRRIRAEAEKTARLRGLARVTEALVVEAQRGGRVLPPVTMENEVRAPLPRPGRWIPLGRDSGAGSGEGGSRGEGGGVLRGEGGGVSRGERERVSRGEESVDPAWTPESLARLERVPKGFMREAVRGRIVAQARASGMRSINVETVEAAIAQARREMEERLGGGGGGGPREGAKHEDRMPRLRRRDEA